MSYARVSWPVREFYRKNDHVRNTHHVRGPADRTGRPVDQDRSSQALRGSSTTGRWGIAIEVATRMQSPGTVFQASPMVGRYAPLGFQKSVAAQRVVYIAVRAPARP